jgi:hypothetical protein
MVLIKFRTTDGAKKFVKNYNGKPFNSMEVGVFEALAYSGTHNNL